MISKFSLLGILSLASSALADHTSEPEAPLARRGEMCNNDPYYIRWNTNSASSVLYGPYFRFVMTTVTIPTLKGDDGAVLITMSLDSGCVSGSIQIGLQGNIVGGKASWNAWGQWLPKPAVDLNVRMQAGDIITLIITAYTSKTGRVFWQNQGGVIATHDFVQDNSLCMMNAMWSVQIARDQDGRPHPLADFGTITFNHAMAKAIGSTNTYLPCGPSGYSIYAMRENDGTYLASATAIGASLVVRYVKSK